MGCSQSSFRPSELLDGISTTPSPAQTCITVVSPAGRCTFPIPESVRMVRDLLAYVNKKQSDGVVALASESGAEVLDVLLQDENSNCDFLRDGDVLVAIPRGIRHAELVSGEVNLSHFSLLKVIGRGGTSTVYSGPLHSVRKKDTGRLYALKVLTKRFLIKEDKLAQIFSEREVLIKAASPFVVKLHWLFQSVMQR